MARANYDLPEEKLNLVKAYTKAKSKREAIIIALDEYLRQKKLKDLLAMRGKLKLRWSQESLKKFRG